MKAQQLRIPSSSLQSPHPARSLFASVRSSRDVTLVAFVAALLAAFAIHAGAFLPRVIGSRADGARPAPSGAAGAVMARRAAAAVAPDGSPVVVLPCEGPRG